MSRVLPLPEEGLLATPADVSPCLCCRGEVSCVSSLGGKFLGKGLRVPSH